MRMHVCVSLKMETRTRPLSDEPPAMAFVERNSHYSYIARRVEKNSRAVSK